MKETFVEVKPEFVRVRIVDDERGTVVYALQSFLFGKWRNCDSPLNTFYNVSPSREPAPRFGDWPYREA